MTVTTALNVAAIVLATTATLVMVVMAAPFVLASIIILAILWVFDWAYNRVARMLQ